MDRLLRATFEEANYVVTQAASAGAALARIGDRVDTATAELGLSEAGTVAVLRDLRAADPDVRLVVVKPGGSVASAMAAMKSGAYDCMSGPIDGDAMLLLVGAALATTKLWRDV